MKHWFNLSKDKPWEKEEELQFGIPKKKITPDDYMISGWDTQGEVHYVRGSRHNKIGLTIMWTYYIVLILMVIRLIIVLNSTH